MTAVSVDTVRLLHERAGDRVHAEQDARRSRGEPSLIGESERQFARAVIAEVLREHVEALLRQGQPPMPDDIEVEMADAVFARMFGAGRLQRLLDDESIENIDINGCDEVWISRAGQEFPERAPAVAATDAELIELVQTLASYSGLSSRAFDRANPQLDLQLPDGSRLSALMAVTDRPSISIRRHRFQKVSLSDLVGLGTMSEAVADFLRAVTQARFNVVISGGTNGGKTTLLRAVAAEIDPRERIVTIEKAFELGIRTDAERHPNVVAMEARPANSEGAGEITMAQLVKRTLRQNPSRVIVGEVLGDEIVPMLNAMTQGNDGSLSTIHADAARETFARISSYAQQANGLPRSVVHEMIAGAIDFVVFISRDRQGSRRRVRTILEINGYDTQIGVAASEVFHADRQGDAVRGHGVAIQRSEALKSVGWTDAGGDW